jgi:phage shock protein PspC (stress-responsive transcriptional regulator)
MNKTINVNLGGLVFSIVEDGYAKLHDYLESLKAHFAAVSYGSEVIADIEARIAEQFNEKTAGNPQRAITDADVTEVLKAIGSVEDFEGVGNTAKQSSAAGPKKLYRNTDDVIIAGVGSGLAAYFGIDTTLARIILFVTVLAGGWGLLLYLLLWLMLPEAKTAGQKLEMKGSPVTIKQIEQTAKEKISEVRASGAGRKLGNFLGMLVKIFVRIILVIIGAAVTLAAIVASFAVAFGFANVLFNRNSPYIDFPVSSVFHGGEYAVAIILGFITILIPLIFLALGGITLVRLKKPPVNGLLASVLAIIWVVAAIGTGVFAVNKAPAIQAAVNEYRGNVETRTLQFSDFNKIDASSAYRVNVVPGKNYAVEVVGHARDLDESNFSVDNSTLTLKHDGKIICFFCWNDEVTVNITMPSLDSIKASGAVEYTVGTFSSDHLDMDLSGASKASIQKYTATSINATLSGASSATITGTTKTLKLNLSGASRFSGFDMASDDVVVEVSGASHVEVTAVKTLNADASGASTVSYKGNPRIENRDESGSSHIRPE